MNKLKKYIPLLLLTLFISNSCSDDFLDVVNKNDLAESSFFTQPDDAYFAINTCYYGLAGRGMHGLNYYFMINSFDDRILFETQNMDDIIISSSTNQVQSLYQDLYIGLFRSTSTLSALLEREIPGLDENLKNRYIGEARALIAAYQFHLVVLFNQPTFYDELSIPADPGGDYGNGNQILFWDNIVYQIQEAVKYLPEVYGSDDVGRITKGAAYAMLGKAMLYKHYHYHVRFGTKGTAEDIADLELAKSSFEYLINSGDYELIQPLAPKTRLDYIYAHLSNFSYVPLPSENNVYGGKSGTIGENTIESVWEIQYSDDRIQGGWLPAWQWSGHLNEAYFSPHATSFKNHEIHPDLWFEFETVGAPDGFDRDPRAYSTCFLDGDLLDFREENATYFNARYKSGSNNKAIASNRGLARPLQPTVGFGLKKYFFPVYFEKDSPSNSPVNRLLIRYADVLLMYAETSFLLGETTGPGLDALNDVRARVDMPGVEALSYDAIIHERDVELATEGHRFLDLIRWSFDTEWGIDWFEIYGKSIFQVGKNEYLPIPLYEINLGHGIYKQNPGW